MVDKMSEDSFKTLKFWLRILNFCVDMEQDMMDTYNAFAPSQSEVDSFKEKLENSKAEQKNLFLIIFQVGHTISILNFYPFYSDLLQLYLITLKSMEN